MTTIFQMRLIDAVEAPGQIRLASLAPLAAALQEVTTRVGRYVEGRHGPGRSPSVYESLTEVTLVKVTEGSTLLTFRRGDDAHLDLDLRVDQLIDDTLGAVFAALDTRLRPPWMGDALAESTVHLAETLRRTSPEVAVGFPHSGELRFRTGDLDPTAWSRRLSRFGEHLALVGRLTAVDVESRRFALRDDAGNRLPLDRVIDADHAAELVGRRVRARGPVVRDADGLPVRLEDVRLEAAAQVPEWRLLRDADARSIVSAVPGPAADGGIDLSDKDYEALLRAIDG